MTIALFALWSVSLLVAGWVHGVAWATLARKKRPATLASATLRAWCPKTKSTCDQPCVGSLCWRNEWDRDAEASQARRDKARAAERKLSRYDR